MIHGPFGWDYPAGAENDPRAPWNQPDQPQCEICGIEYQEFDDDGIADETSCDCQFCEFCDKRLADDDIDICAECHSETAFENSQNSFEGYNEQ